MGSSENPTLLPVLMNSRWDSTPPVIPAKAGIQENVKMGYLLLFELLKRRQAGVLYGLVKEIITYFGALDSRLRGCPKNSTSREYLGELR